MASRLKKIGVLYETAAGDVVLYTRMDHVEDDLDSVENIKKYLDEARNDGKVIGRLLLSNIEAVSVLVDMAGEEKK